MLKSREQLISRLSAYRQAVQLETLVSKAPIETDHNARARILRNGLAVVGYAFLEDFLRSRVVEVVGRIGQGATRFSDLPEEIKLAATQGVFNAVLFQKRFVNTQTLDILRHYQDHASLVASTANTNYEISPFAFVHEQSNISSRNIEETLKAFRVTNPWNTLVSVATRCGVGVFTLKNAFDDAAARRHEAAHRADADIEHSDLSDYDVEVLGIAIAFDLLISKALRRLLDADADYLSKNGSIAGKHISIRFLRYDGSKWWREVLDGNKKAFRRREDFEELKAETVVRARRQGQAVVVQDERGLPASWFTPDTD